MVTCCDSASLYFCSCSWSCNREGTADKRVMPREELVSAWEDADTVGWKTTVIGEPVRAPPLRGSCSSGRPCVLEAAKKVADGSSFEISA